MAILYAASGNVNGLAPSEGNFMLFTKYLHAYKINHDPTIPLLMSILEDNSHKSCAKMWLVAFFIILLENKLNDLPKRMANQLMTYTFMPLSPRQQLVRTIQMYIYSRDRVLKRKAGIYSWNELYVL